jgi:hypothetical protein
MYRQLVFLALVLTLGLLSSAPAATIVWVSFHAADNAPGADAVGVGFTEAPDKGYTDLLKANGFNVTRYVTSATPDAALLNGADLVIISRSVPSGNYEGAAATTWNTTISAPMMILGGYVIRQNRMGFSTGNTIPDTTGDIRLTAANPAHPIFAGIPLTAGTMANPYAGVVPIPTDGTMSRGISIVTEAANANGTVLATVAPSGGGPAGAMVIAEWPAGVTVTHAGGAGTDTLAGPRLVFLTGSREPSGVTGGQAAGIYDLHPDGERMFLNAVRYMLGVPAELASDPSPEKGAIDVPFDTTMSWTAGEGAGTRDVYFGTSFADVNDASRTDPRGILVSQGQTATTFVLPDLLEYGQVYYWRVDEISAAPDATIFQGEVWSFTVEPYAYPIRNITATASSAQDDSGPQNTVNGSGLDDQDRHSTDEKAMWVSTGDQPSWIQFEFDQAYKLHELWVWNYNHAFESFLGWGAKDVKIEYSLDGDAWTELEDVPPFAQGIGAPAYAANTTVSFAGVFARFVKLTILGNWGGMPQTGLSEVRFFHVPVQAREPVPADGATAVALDATLGWRPGREAQSHKVYFGADADAVAAGTAPATDRTQRSYTPPALDLWTTYFWRVDEVGETGTFEGNLWSFTTQEFLVVDDFESYDDKENRIYQVWVDGETNNTGSQVGHLETAGRGTFGERTIVRSGTQSMPIFYDNAGKTTAEAQYNFAAQNWTARGVKSLSLYFHGAPDNTGQLYVKIGNTKVVYDGDAADIQRAAWQPWNIDLSKVGGNLSNVTTLTIGIEGPGATGVVYIDDVRLYPIVQRSLLTGFVRVGGASDNRAPIGAYDGTTRPLPIEIGGLRDGAPVFSDRTFTWADVPAELVGSDYIRSFNNDKNAGTVDLKYTVTLARPALMWITCDDRIPANWNAGGAITTQQDAVDLVTSAFAAPGTFVYTGMKLIIMENPTTPRPMSVYAAELQAGTYVFGSQDSGGNIYTIGAKE